MAAQRKLFLTHAGELAHRLMHDVDGDGLVARFVRSYAERYGRYGLLGDPARLPELASTIGREALLVMAADVRRLLPQAFSPGPKGALRPDDAAFVDAFHAEFLAALMRALDLPPEDPGKGPSETAMFRRDLEMYRHWGQRPGPAAGAASAGGGARAGESPFRDRCALLLDPAMMEQARRSAADFEGEILHTTERRFAQLGRLRVFTARPTRGRGAKARVRRKAKLPRRGAKRKLPSGPAKPMRSKKKPMRRKKRKPAGRRRTSRG